ncbi:hypothetical protein [Saccharolobus islandicus]|uniref:HTH marR-type domain-containing protein n=1 Tax=Saccharolobus islandicus (strain L.D.8.5 / Lassen \|nr:hypothetical protein [Sulfolobus islandicus]ADB88731.1 conserved hypothetical protein [Sulfolobus islandicus L.D.8.5]
MDYTLSETAQKLLVALLKKDGVTIRELIDLAEVNNTPALRALEELQKYKLIREERETTFPRRRLIYLTDDGKYVATRIKEIMEVLVKNHPPI